MNYAESFDYIMNIPHFAKTNTLERIREILSALDHPEGKLQFIHVAGTNGKGSTVTMLSSILHADGKRVGTFVSPFVYDFLERIQIDCRPVSRAVFAEAMTRVRAVVETLSDPANFFEILTATALLIFQEAACNIVVLEVGLGGRLDATNVIPAPQLAMITSIGLDHTMYLGETLSEIAAEKCGIIKPGSHVITDVSAPQEVRSVIETACVKANAPLIPAKEDFSFISESIEGSVVSYRGKTLTIPLAGRHQMKNLALVLCAAQELSIPLDAIARGLSAVHFPARFEIVCHAPLTIVDGAHNPDGMRALAHTVKTLLPGRRITTIFGVLQDKNMREMAQIAESFSDFLILAPPPSPRAAAPDELLPFCRGVAANNFNEALHIAKAQSGLDVLLICGSLYLAGSSQQAQEIIKTDRLILREMRRRDLPDLCEILQDETVMVAYEHAFSDTEVEAWYQNQRRRYREDGFGLWAVVSRESGEMLGQCGLTLQEIPGETVCEVGYLFKKRFWHNGYATEAARACMDYAFQTLNQNAVYSIIRDNNLPSQAVAQRNGLNLVGSFTKHYYGIDMPHLIYQKTNKERTQ